ncbi:MAG: hypothetical protein HY259_13895 [Chloroflexi bacterium]|nr:hypothetical protein [Chloroflexota bacterium]MBI3734529.1 hypothetical protein [Chloroflexota bacterium]
MSQTVIVSDALYARLATAAKKSGFSSIEQLLEAWQVREDELRQRQDAVQHIDAVRERLAAIYGQQPDSVELIREDRLR